MLDRCVNAISFLWSQKMQCSSTRQWTCVSFLWFMNGSSRQCAGSRSTGVPAHPACVRHTTPRLHQLSCSLCCACAGSVLCTCWWTVCGHAWACGVRSGGGGDVPCLPHRLFCRVLLRVAVVCLLLHSVPEPEEGDAPTAFTAGRSVWLAQSVTPNLAVDSSSSSRLWSPRQAFVGHVSAWSIVTPMTV